MFQAANKRRMVERVGNWSYRHPWRVLAFASLALVILTASAGALGGEFRQTFAIPGSEANAAAGLLEETGFEGADRYQGHVVVTAGDVRQPRVRAVLEDLLEDIQRGVPGAHVDAARFEVSHDATVGVAVVDMGDDLSGARQQAEQIVSLHQGLEVPDGVGFEFGGEPFEREAEFSSEVFGLAAAAVILLLAFGSPATAALPIVTALVGIGGAAAVVQMATRFVDIPPFTPGLVAMIGIGAGIDYSLFVVTRYREELPGSGSRAEAVARAIATAGRATAFAGITVVISLLALLVVGLDDVQSVALAAASGVLFVMLASITVLPALLRAAASRIGPLKGDVFRRSGKPQSAASFWHRWSRMLQKRPVPAAIASTVVLLVLAAPVAGMRLGLSDAGNRPEGDTTRRAYDLISEGFGPGFNGPLFVVAELPDRAAPGELTRFADTVRSVDGVERVGPPIVGANEEVALLEVIPETGPQDQQTSELVHRLRNDSFQGSAAPPGARLLVGGAPAAVVDFSQHNAGMLPWVIGIVLVLSFCLLMAVFRSLLVPLKAVIINLLSVGAAYGVLVAVFQWGWLPGVFEVGRPGPIEAWVPMIMFAIVFGLSMDYEVFLLSRIREEYNRTLNNSAAVAEGIARTARLISAAAGIMVCVFGAFVLSGERSLQMMGMGLAVAIAVDATLVRLVLVPSTMELLGDRNWWLPLWLRRRLPRLLIVEPSADVFAPDTAGDLPGKGGHLRSSLDQ